jgi:hypothetical protein
MLWGKSPDTLHSEGIAETRRHRSTLRLLLSQFFFVPSTLLPFALLSRRIQDHISKLGRPYGRRYESALLGEDF